MCEDRSIAGGQSAGPDPIPRKGDAWSYQGFSNPSSTCQSITAQQNRQNWSEWLVECEWSPVQPGQVTGTEGNPLQQPVEYWIEHVTYTELITRDRLGRPIVNTAGQQFDTALEQEATRMVLMARKNFANLQSLITLNLRHADTVNSVPFRGAGARQWLCGPIDCSLEQKRNNVRFYTGTFRLHLNPQTWDRYYVNSGLEAYNNADDKELQKVQDRNGNPIDTPQLLKADGTQEDWGVEATSDHVLSFEVRGLSNFSLLGI